MPWVPTLFTPCPRPCVLFSWVQSCVTICPPLFPRTVTFLFRLVCLPESRSPFSLLVRFPNLSFRVLHFRCLTLSLRSDWCCQLAPSRLWIFLYIWQLVTEYASLPPKPLLISGCPEPCFVQSKQGRVQELSLNLVQPILVGGML